MIADLLNSLPGSVIRDVLVLGDPAARICRELREHGLMITCCTDLQSSPDADHAGALVSSLDSLLDGGGRWDAVVALDGFDRINDVRSPVARSRMMHGLRQITDLLVLTPARRECPAPDLNDLGPYDTADLFACFPLLTECELTPTGGSAGPLIVASTQLLGLGDQWVRASELRELSRTASGVSHTVRTFEWHDAIIKVEAASEHYFERCQALAEARFLTTVDESIAVRLSLPRVRLIERGRAVSHVLRDRVEGRSLEPGEARGSPQLLEHVVSAAADLAACGLFHNDLRPWNLLYDGSNVRFVDWAEASTCDADVRGLPQVLALAGTLAALLTDEIPWSNGFVEGTAALVPPGMGPLSQRDVSGREWLALPAYSQDLLHVLASPSEWETARIVAHVLGLATTAMGDSG
jgi:predicted Ser/Thr protein kinase